MTVLHLVYDLSPGGYQSLLLGLLPPLAERGVEVEVVSLTDRLELAEAFRDRGIPVRSLGKSGPPGPAFGSRLCRALRESSPDLVQTHGFSAGVWGRLGSAGMPCRCLVTVHEEAGWMKPRRRKWTNRAMLPLTERMVAVSGCVRDSLMAREGIPADRIVVIPNGIDPGHYRRTRTRLQAREEVGVDPQALWVGMIGRCRREKGGDVWLRALATLASRRQEVRGVLIGDGADLDGWRRLARDLGLEDRVRFPGSVADVRPWMQALDVLAAPSRQESSGLVVLEALAAECPVVASRVGGIPDWITDGDNGLLVPPEDPCALAEGMERILADPDGAGTRTEQGLCTLKTRGTLETTLRLTMDLYGVGQDDRI